MLCYFSSTVVSRQEVATGRPLYPRPFNISKSIVCTPRSYWVLFVDAWTWTKKEHFNLLDEIITSTHSLSRKKGYSLPGWTELGGRGGTGPPPIFFGFIYIVKISKILRFGMKFFFLFSRAPPHKKFASVHPGFTPNIDSFNDIVKQFLIKD